MAFPVYLPLYVGLVLALVAPQVARRLPPRTEVWCLTSAALVAASSWVFSLGMIAFTGLGRTDFVARHAHWSADKWREVDPVGVWAADAAGVVLGLCLAIFVWTACHEAIAARQVRRLTDGFTGDERLVFVSDEAPHAYAIAGRRPRIVMSRGLVRALGAVERRAVIAHEEAHLRHHHHAHLRVLRLAATVNPFLRRFLPAGVLAVERWADEDSAVRVGDRTLVARTLLRAALAGAGAARMPAGVLAHTADGLVGRRVTALMQAPPRPRRSIAIAVSVMLVATVLTPVYAASHLDGLMDQASVSGP